MALTDYVTLIKLEVAESVKPNRTEIGFFKKPEINY